MSEMIYEDTLQVNFLLEFFGVCRCNLRLSIAASQVGMVLVSILCIRYVQHLVTFSHTAFGPHICIWGLQQCFCVCVGLSACVSIDKPHPKFSQSVQFCTDGLALDRQLGHMTFPLLFFLLSQTQIHSMFIVLERLRNGENRIVIVGKLRGIQLCNNIRLLL